METCKKMSFIFFNFTLLICLASLTIPNALARYRGPRNIDGNVSSEINVIDLKHSETDFVDVDVQNITESSQSVFTKVNDNENVIDSTISHVQYVSEYNVTDFISSNSENILGQPTSVTDSVLSSSGTTKLHSIEYPVVTEALIKNTNSTDTLPKISLYNVEEPPVSVNEVFSELSVTPASQVNTGQVLPVNNVNVNKNLTSSLFHKDSENTTTIMQSSPTMQTIESSFSFTEKPNLNSLTTKSLSSRRRMLLANEETSVSVADEVSPVLDSISISNEIPPTSLSDRVISTPLTDTFTSASVSEHNLNESTFFNPSSNAQTEETTVQATNVNSGDTTDTTNTPEYQGDSTQVVTAQTANSDYQTDSDIDADARTTIVRDIRSGTNTSSDAGGSSDIGTGMTTSTVTGSDVGMDTGSSIDTSSGTGEDSDIGTGTTTSTITDSDTGTGTGSGTDTGSGAGRGSGSGTGTTTSTITGSDTGTGTGSGTDTGSGAGRGSGSGTGTTTSTITGSDTGTGTGSGTDTGSGAGRGSGSGTGMTTSTVTSSDTGTGTGPSIGISYSASTVSSTDSSSTSDDNITTTEDTTDCVPVPNLKEISTNKTFAVLECNIADSCVPGSCIVNCTADDGNLLSGISNEFTNGSTIVNVTGLSPFTDYSCKGYVSTDNDTSEESETINITTLEDAPPAPKIDIVEFSRSLNISWTINEEEVFGEIINFIITADFMGSNATTNCASSDNICFCNETSFTRHEVDAEKRSYSLIQLKPYSYFSITVSASTNGGSNTSEAKIAMTKADQSEAVRSLKYNISEGGDDINWKTVLNWELPCNTQGELKGFYIHVSNISHSLEFYEKYLPCNCCEYILPELQPDSSYTVLVSAYVDGINGSLSDSVQFTYPPGIPKISESTAQHLTADPFATSTPTQTRITFNHDLFQGQITWYEIIVAQKGKEEQPTKKTYADPTKIPHINSWNNAVNGESYRATPDKWNPFLGKSNEIATFILGDLKCDDNGYYCNGALKAETDYAVKIRAYTGSDRGGYQDTSIIYFTTGGEVAVGVIVGILMAIIVLGSLAILFIMYRRGTLVWPPKFFKGSIKTTVRPQPILLKKFPAYCVQLLETPNRLKNEFQLLATLSFDINTENTTVYGEQPENRKKNRYINILPYDATRVILNLVDGDQTSHYINASFIQGYNSDLEYIASQGPLEDTCEDFWRMVYQHDVRVIAMVTNLVEQNKLKCHQYYPNLRENLVFGDMTIRCTTEINFPIHTARTLILIKEGRERKISHLHFREWPDFGVPQSTDFMLQFCQTMRHHAMAAQLGLILVHCSAGVGRTGTLIAIDILLQHISENKKVDIFGTVYKLRKQRTNMVQTEGQYTYIYRCIKDAVEDPTIVNQGTMSNSSLEPIYENVGTTLNSLQYEKLPKVSYKSSSSESECEL